MQDSYKLDRTAFAALSFDEADKLWNDDRHRTWQERFRLHQYLNSIAYRYAGKEPPRMDKTVFAYGKTANGEHFLS